jgi:hypothetical protein
MPAVDASRVTAVVDAPRTPVAGGGPVVADAAPAPVGTGRPVVAGVLGGVHVVRASGRVARGPVVSGVRRPLRARPSVGRVIWWQLAVIPVLLAPGRSWAGVMAFGVVAVVLLVLGAGRARGTWLSTVVGRRVALVLRRAHRTGAPAVDPAGAVLRRVAPGARITATGIGDARIGVVSRPQGTVACVAPVGADAADVVRAAFRGELGNEDPEVDTRSELIVHRGPRQHRPRTWLTVRVARTADVPDDAVLDVCLTNATRRLLRRARHCGLDLRALTEEELRATVASLAHTGPPKETWRHWHTGDIAQAGLRLHGPRSRDETRTHAVERLLAATPDVAFTLAVALDVAHLSGHVRLAAPDPSTVDAAVDRIVSTAQLLDIRLERLDGRHGRALAATLPIGGTLE